MKNFMKSKAVAATLCVALFGTAIAGYNTFAGEHTAHAQSVSAIQLVRGAKAKGLIGETIAGYLEVVNGQTLDAATRAAMNEINIRRRDEEYRPIAKRDGLTLEQVARAFGEKLTTKTPPGQYILTEAGQWVRK